MMNEMPVNWLVELSEAYPKRSGPCGWNGMKMLLCVRRALLESTWIEIMNGVKRYAKFCSQAGKEGTEYVLSPKAFFDDAVYLEDFTYIAPKSKDERALEDIRKSDAQRMAKAVEAGGRLVPALRPYPLESVGSFETRLRLFEPNAKPGSDRPVEISGRIASLVSRLKQA